MNVLCKRFGILILFIMICLMLAGEISKQRAREASDRFLGPLLERLEWQGSTFIPWVQNANNEVRFLSWHEWYEDRFLMGEPTAIEVDLLGRVTFAENKILRQLIGLPDKERFKKEIEIIEELKDKDSRKMNQP